MPGRHVKQVRFADKNTFHSAPPTPALSFLTSTIPSSSGVITPSSVTRGLPEPSSYERAYPKMKTKATTPNSHSRRVAPHRYLERTGISWDLRDHHSAITRDRQVLSRHALQEPATSPSMPFIRATSSYLPWSVKVWAANGAFVTVEDVVEGVYRALRTNISQPDFNLLTSSSDQHRASRAYEDRYRRLRTSRHYEEEKRSGMRRVDFLMGHTQFVGLANNGRRPDEWHLSVR